MDYDFTTVVNRHQQNSSKWALMKMKNPNVPDNIIPLSVADKASSSSCQLSARAGT